MDDSRTLRVVTAPGSPRQIELDVFGVDFTDRPGITRERIEALRRIWAWQAGDEPLDVSTANDRGVLSGRISPSSFRKPHPLVGRATMTDATIVEAALLGWPAILALRTEGDDNRRQLALYRSTLEGAGHDEATVRECLSWLSLTSLVSIAPTEQEARRRHEEEAGRGLATSLASVRAAQARRDEGDRVRPVGAMQPATVAVFLETAGLSAAEVVDRLAALVASRRTCEANP